MTVVLLSDLHYQGAVSKREAQEHRLKQLNGELSRINTDVLVFAGDLLDRCGTDYRETYELFRAQLLDGLDFRKFVLACGNHDIDRNIVKPMFRKHVSELVDTNELDDFVKKDVSHEFSENLGYLKPFNEIVQDKIGPPVDSYLYYCDNVVLDGKKIGITSINTSWAAFGDGPEYGHLIFPTTCFHEIARITRDNDFNLLVSHYPISYLAESYRRDAEELVYRNFDILLSGHTHHMSKSIAFSASDALCAIEAPSSIGSRDPRLTGYLVLNVDVGDYSLTLSDYRQFEGNFVKRETVNISIPASAEKKDALSIRRAIINRYKVALDEATHTTVLQEDGGMDFETVFTEPVLKGHGEVVNVAQLHKRAGDPAEQIAYTSILNAENYLIVGPEKSGKTTLLLKMHLDYLKSFGVQRIIPVMIDMGPRYRRHDASRLDVVRLVRGEFNASNKLARRMKEAHHVHFLIDNFDPTKTDANKPILDAIRESDNLGAVIAVTSLSQASFTPEIHGLTYKELHLHTIGKKQIRSFVNKWPSIGGATIEDVISKLTSIFTQLNIHYNYWTVSLFLWIFQRTSAVNIHNNVELIDLYVENLLDKPGLAIDAGKSFSYDNYMDFLGELAHRLFQNFEPQDYAAPYSEIVQCFDEFKSSNIRVVADPRFVIDYVLEKAIIIKVGSDAYTFRLNGVFEYFLAHHMRRDKSFKDSVTGSDTLFLSFGNEIEIYAGLCRADEDLLIHVYYNALTALGRYLDANPGYRDLAVTVGEQPRVLQDLNSLFRDTTEKLKPLAVDEKDEWEDSLAQLSPIESAVRTKPKYSLSEIDTDGMCRHIFILGRAFRSLDAIEDRELIDEVFDFIIDQGCLMFYFFLSDLRKKEGSYSSSWSGLLELIECFAPVFSFSFIYDAMAHVNLENLVRQRIDKISTHEEPNLLKLFVLYFMLVEQDLGDSLGLVDEIIELSQKNNLVLSSIMLKLIEYVIFKCESSDMESRLKKRILRINKTLHPSDRSGKIVQEIDRGKLKQKAQG